MAIPMSSSPPPLTPDALRAAIIAGELVTGRDSDFNGGIGNWVARSSPATCTYGTAIKYAGSAGSAKVTCTTTYQGADVTLPGTFKAGVAYHMLIVFYGEPTDTDWLDYRISFGKLGTNFNDAMTDGVVVNGGFNTGRWMSTMLRWVPTADRTGVQVRIGQAYFAWGAAAWVVDVGLVRVRAMANKADLGFGLILDPDYSPGVTGDGVVMTKPYHFGDGLTEISGGDLAGHVGIKDGGVELMTGDQSAQMMLGMNGAAGIDAPYDDTPADLMEFGFYLEVGPDFAGIYVSEGAGGQMQLYPYDGTGIDVELVDRGTNKHWKTRDEAGTYSADLITLTHLLVGTADPTSGGGVAHPMPAMYLRDNSGSTELWLASGAGATSWTKQTSP